MAYQSEIELRVKVIDAELKELEKRIERVQNPFGPSGARKGAADRQLRENLRIEKERLDFVKRAVEDEERLRIAKARNTQRIKQRLLQLERSNRIKAAQDVARAEEALARQNARRREDLALGVGFPLLFGGGAGAVAGGALGAVAGGGKGGFGLQILFSALGQQIDNFFAGVQESATSVAAAMDGTSASLEAVKEAGIVVRDSTIEYVQELEDSGRSLDAYNAVQRELNNIYGTEGVTVLQELKGANEFANTEAGKLSAVLQTEMAPAFILLAQIAGGAARALREVIPAIADAIGEFTLGIPGATTTAQLSVQRPGTNQGLIDAGVRQREQELRTDAEIQGITASTEALKRQSEIAKLNNDLTDKRVVALRRQSIEIEAQSEISALQKQSLEDVFNADLQRLNAAKIQEIQQQKIVDLAKLEVNERKAVTAATEQAAREQERLEKAAERAAAKAEKARMKELQDRIDIATKARQAELDKEEKFQARINALGQEIDIQKAILNGDEDRVRAQIEINSLVKLFGEEKRAQIELLVGEKFQIEQQNKLLQEQDAIFERIGSSIASGVVDTLSAAVDQTKSLAEVAADTLRNVANILLQFGVNTALGGIGSAAGSGSFLGKLFAGFRASGGPVSGGRSYVVGERGPELFVPNTSGTVVPNGNFGGATNVVVNVDAKGTSASGDGGQAKQLGGLIGAAVQAELVKQQRPGGLLAR